MLAVNRMARRPGRVVRLCGLLFQCDARDPLSEWLIHPLEQMDRRLVGLSPTRLPHHGLAAHVGIHVEVELDGQPREVVAEQLFGSTPAGIAANVLHCGLHWTPLADVARRDHGGWHVTIPAAAFRHIDQPAIQEAVVRLNTLRGRPFLVEDCIGFVERAFGGRPLFADSPLLMLLGARVGVADPALPLLRPQFPLAPHAAALLRADALYALPDARRRTAHMGTVRRGLALGLPLAGAVLGMLLCRRSDPWCRVVGHRDPP